jgi:hypothetical protein
MSSANRDTLTSSFPFISSSFLIALARNSKTMLNKIPDLEEMFSVFPHLV